MKKLSTFLIGETALLIECGKVLLEKGHSLLGVFSHDPAVQKWAKFAKIPCYQEMDDFEKATNLSSFDYLFSIANPHILKPALFQKAKKFAINYHDAPLPRYAGVNATSWALINGEKTHGVTWHILVEKVDAGDILVQKWVDIAPDDTVSSLNLKCAEQALKGFEELIPELSSDTYTAKPQDASQRTFYALNKPLPNGGMIDWNTPATTIQNLLRGTAFASNMVNRLGLPKFEANGHIYILNQLSLTSNPSSQPAGTIVGYQDNYFVIATATVDIQLLQISDADGTTLSCHDFIHHTKLNAGSRLNSITDDLQKCLNSCKKSEKFWVNQLKNISSPPMTKWDFNAEFLQTSQHPFRYSFAIPGPLKERLSEKFSAQASLEEILLASILLCGPLLFQLENNITIRYSYPNLRSKIKDFKKFFASSVPLIFSNVLPETVYDLLKSVKTELQKVQTQETYSQDVFLRYPTLRTQPLTKESQQSHFSFEVIEDNPSVSSTNDPQSVIALRWNPLLSQIDISSFIDLSFKERVLEKLSSQLIHFLNLFCDNPTLNFSPDNIKCEHADLNVKHEFFNEGITPDILKGRPQIKLSDSQYRLGYLEQKNEYSTYNWLLSFQIEGELNIDLLNKSLRHLIKRHESLRMGIDFENGVQIITPHDNIHWQMEFIQDDRAPSNKNELEKFIAQECGKFTQQKFNLSHTPLLRSKVIQLSSNDHDSPKKFLWLCVIHSSIFDDYSRYILLRELASLYNGYQRNLDEATLDLTLGNLPVHYTTYCQWLRTIPRAIKNEQLAYWKNKLENYEALDLPLDFPRPLHQNLNCDRVLFSLTSHQVKQIETFSEKCESNLFTSLLASFQFLLHKYSGQADICTGIIVTNRNKSPKLTTQLQNVIGFIANTLPIRTQFNDQDTIKKFIQRVKHNVDQSVTENSDVTFEEIYNALTREYEPNRNPLFETLFVYHDFFETLNLPGLQTKDVETGWANSHLDLTINIRKTAHNEITGYFEYSANLFQKETIQRLASNFTALLHAFSSIETKICDVDFVCAEEQQLITSFHNKIHLDQTLCIHEIVEQTANLHPQKSALIYNDQVCTYEGLNRKANQFGLYLVENNIKPNNIIAICMDRSIELIIVMLGILKAGCTVLCLETIEDAKERNTVKIQSASPAAIITHDKTHTLFLQTRIKIPVYNWDQSLTKKMNNDYPERIGLPKVKIDDLALLSMTSGSTGNPKGVLVSHRGWTNWITYLQNFGNQFNIEQSSHVYLSAPLPFDASFWEIFVLALGQGATLYMTDSDTRLDKSVLINLFHKNQITVATFTPSTLRELGLSPDEFPSIKSLICIGEELSKELISPWLKNAKVLNGYGPTESTAGVTLYSCTENEPINIGKPIDNTSIYILDNHQKSVPLGAFGEIYIGGVGVAKGYLNLPEKTAQVFVKDPFTGLSMYKTGDKGHFLKNGNIYYDGRIDGDREVKILGVRIQLDEIEKTLLSHPNIAYAYVKLTKNVNKAYLAAYILYKKKEETLETKDIKIFLREKGLPTIKIPSVIIALDKLPLTVNGKLDSKALPVIDSYPEQRQIQKPGTPTEEILFQLWTQALPPISNLSVTDDFNSVGGNSLLLMKLLSKIREKFFPSLHPSSFPASDLPYDFTIQSLAEIIAKRLESLSAPKEDKKEQKEDDLDVIMENNFWASC